MVVTAPLVELLGLLFLEVASLSATVAPGASIGSSHALASETDREDGTELELEQASPAPSEAAVAGGLPPAGEGEAAVAALAFDMAPFSFDMAACAVFSSSLSPLIIVLLRSDPSDLTLVVSNTSVLPCAGPLIRRVEPPTRTPTCS
jgi:hypothetical protein